MENKGKYYITTAIAYASGKPHIGNTYEIVLADAIARYRRNQGYDVFFMTGTDEHGLKIQQKAEAAGVTPQKYVDDVAAEVKRIFDLMNTSYNKFIRTTDEDHVKVVQKLSRNSTIREISTSLLMKAGTACPASPSSPSLSWQRDIAAPTADVP